MLHLDQVLVHAREHVHDSVSEILQKYFRASNERDRSGVPRFRDVTTESCFRSVVGAVVIEAQFVAFPQHSRGRRKRRLDGGSGVKVGMSQTKSHVRSMATVANDLSSSPA